MKTAKNVFFESLALSLRVYKHVMNTNGAIFNNDVRFGLTQKTKHKGNRKNLKICFQNLIVLLKTNNTSLRNVEVYNAIYVTFVFDL